ncbi:MAG: tetratricopeptide repeat protein [Rhodospirillaceae bacterium]
MKAIIHAGLLFIALTLVSVGPAASGVFEIEVTSASRQECVLALPRPFVLAGQNRGREQRPDRPEVSLPCAEAVTLYRQAAALGDRVAQNNLGVIYEEGHGTAQDYQEATNWYRKAAEQGDAVAQANLGFMYFYGRGVAQNFILAHMWASLAAAAGDARGSCLRDVVAQMMPLSDIAAAQKLAEEWKPRRPG